MKTRFILSLIFILSFNFSQAQSVRDNLFFQWGAQFGIFTLPSYDRLTDSGEKFADQDQFYDVGVNFGIRYNLKKINDEQSLGLITSFGFGTLAGKSILSSTDKNGIFNIPIDFSYHYGAGSSYFSSKDFGLTVRAGVDFNFLFTTESSYDTEFQKFKSRYILPHLGLGVSFWDKTDSWLQEVFLRVEFGKNQHTGPVLNDEVVKSPIGLRLCYTAFIGF